jgi:hypothetical protein
LKTVAKANLFGSEAEVIKLPDGSVVNVDTADAASLREAARQFRQAEIETQNNHQWAHKYRTPPPEPPPQTLASLRRDDVATPTPEEAAERQRVLNQARAMAQIQAELEKEAATAAQAQADAARATRARFRPQSTLQRILSNGR